MTDHRVLRTLADERDRIHSFESHNRPLSLDYEYVGLIGEDEFAKEFGLKMNLELKRRGDKGVDYYVKGYKIDVKTLRDARFLKVEFNKCRADIYVLYHYIDAVDTAEFIGWEFGDYIEHIEPKDTGRGIINHAIERAFLSDLHSLKLLLGKEKI